MSGITPLIDTLLHQVLGKRADVPPAKPLNQPVKPTAPAEAPRAVHSDSRLDARAPAPTPGEAAKGKPAAGRPLPAPGTAPPSALTHLSGTARTIGDLLVRFPAPPSAVSPAAPLMTPGASATPALLAQHLEGSLRDSGLFYESHLARWYQGKLPPQQLMREPQMLRTQRFQPASPGPEPGATPGAGRMSPLAARVQALVPPVPFLPSAVNPRGEHAPPASAAVTRPVAPSAVTPGTPVAPQPAPAQAGDPSARVAAESVRGPAPEPPLEGARSAGRGEPVHESLQPLVRHQLEMLAAPSLRWEGDVWSGLFMALVIQLPQGRRDDGREGGEHQGDRSGDEAGGWRSELELEVAGLGPITVALWLQETRLAIDLTVRDEAARPRLEEGLERLRRRLSGHGFEEVRLNLAAAPGEDES